MTRKDELTNAVLDSVESTRIAAPDLPAFRAFGRPEVSYAQLWGMSTNLAAALSESPDDGSPLIVLGSKSALTVAAFLACLRTGHAFVPVDVTMPASRMEDITSQLVEASGSSAGDCPVIVTVEPDELAQTPGASLKGVVLASDLIERGRLRLAQAPDPDAGVAPDGLSYAAGERSRWVSGERTQYIIFTSGSTGRPKGIEVTANDVANFAGWVRTFPVVSRGGCVFLDQAPYSFDLSEYELVGALTTGGCLYVVSPQAKDDTRRLFAELSDSGMDVWVSTPSFADLCLVDHSFDRALLCKVGLFLFCGEALQNRTAAELLRRFDGAVVANTYGPTESTVAVTWVQVTPEMAASPDPLPVGRPRPGTQIRIMERDAEGALTGRQCPQGEVGEIVIVGDTVAKDYFANPEKTSAAFSQDWLPDGTPVRAYRTGDLGFLDAEGMLHCKGRVDTLIKLNGFRIEIDDVESNLAELDGVEFAAVVPMRRNGRVTGLKAFVVVDSDTPQNSPQGLRERLCERIPAYMVPRRIKVIEEMPLTSNGKIDRKQLVNF